MKNLIKSNLFKEFELSFSDKNIISFYGENDSGKTSLLNEILKLFKKQQLNLYLNDQEITEILFVEEKIDFQKELSLSKKSILRNRVKNLFIKKLDQSNTFLQKEIENILINLKIKDDVSKILDFNFGNYKVEQSNTGDDIDKFIDYFFNLISTKNSNDEKEEINLSNSIEKLFYYESLLFQNDDIKNNLILLDCPDSFFDSKNINLISQGIKKLSQNNLIILSTRNINLLKKLDLNFNEINLLINKEIKKFLLEDDDILMYKTILEYEKGQFNNFDLLYSQIKLILYEKDFDKLKHEFKNNLFYIIENFSFYENKFYLDLNNNIFTKDFLLFIHFFIKVFSIKNIEKPSIKFKALLEIDI